MGSVIAVRLDGMVDEGRAFALYMAMREMWIADGKWSRKKVVIT